MNITSPTRALVLGGGGSTGNAWLIGVVAGLFEAGVDVTNADLTVGTSAGATAAAQLAGASPTELYSDILNAPPLPSRGPAPSVSDHLERLRGIIASSKGIAEMRRTMGALALERDATEQWRQLVAARFSPHDWPRRNLQVTAVDARTGEPIVFDRESGVDLVDAVAASTSGGGAAYSIGEGRFIDGGYRSNAENADLAAGYGRVLVLSPLGGRSLHPFVWGTHLATHLELLRAGGSRVESVFPAASVVGADAMNAALRPHAARAGHEQGLSLADVLGEFWLASKGF